MDSSSGDLMFRRPFLGRQASKRSPSSTLVHPELTPEDPWRLLSDDMLENILARLPVSPLKACKEVCKRWESILGTPEFDTLHRLLGEQQVWLVCYGMNHLRSKSQAFAYEEEAGAWITLPPMEFPSHNYGSLASANGVVYGIAGPGDNKLAYKLTSSTSCPSAFLGTWEHTPAMQFARREPVVSVAFGTGKEGKGHKVVVAGGVPEYESEHMAVEVFDSETGAWEVYGSLPDDFSGNSSSMWMSGVVCDNKLYVLLIDSWKFYAMDLSFRQWTPVTLQRPQGLVYHHIMAVGSTVVVAGICEQTEGHALNLWKLDPETHSLLQIGSMPDQVFALLRRNSKVPALNFAMNDNVIYVSKALVKDGEWVMGVISLEECKTKWRVLPSVSTFGYRFDNMVTFCTSINISR